MKNSIIMAKIPRLLRFAYEMNIGIFAGERKKCRVSGSDPLDFAIIIEK